jgi:hypothetical protein
MSSTEDATGSSEAVTTSQKPSQDDLLIADMLKLVFALIGRPEASPFREPVDWKILGLHDYLQLVKKPMDLGTIKNKILANEYKSAEEVAGDIRLVWTNCMTYNQDGSEFYQLAETFAKKFEEKYLMLRKQHASSSDSITDDVRRIPTLEERIQMSYDLFKLDHLQLARSLTIIESWSPNALVRKSTESDVCVNIDIMTPRCFNEVASYIRACKPELKNNKKKRPLPAPSVSATSSGSSNIGSAPNRKKTK